MVVDSKKNHNLEPFKKIFYFKVLFKLKTFSKIITGAERPSIGDFLKHIYCITVLKKY